MKAKRQRHQSAFKAKVGLAALAGVKTVAEIAREYQVHPTQVSQWKRAIMDRLPEVFEHGATAQAEASEREVARLEQKVGQLTMELDWLKKVQTTGPVSGERLELVSPAGELSVRRQCAFLGVSRSGYYYEPCSESSENLRLMRRLDELHLPHPVYGRPRLTAVLQREGFQVNEKRVGRLMRVMDLEAIYCKPGTSAPQPGHEIWGYKDNRVSGES